MRLPNRLALAAAALSIAAFGPTPATAQWEVDPNHSQVTFSVTHFFTPVTGSFGEFEIDLAYDAEDPTNSSVAVTIPVGSIDTGNTRRDGHLRSGDFFEIEAHPEMTFKSTSVETDADGRLVATGPLTIKGVSKEIELPIRILGVKDIPAEMQEGMGGLKRVASFTAKTSIDRGDFGVGTGNWASDLVIGKSVEVEIHVEAHLR